ncbi:MAG TPA: YesK family protein [Bacillota bacterium]|nr:YesK family protein [Bacillota bacterium]
MGIFITILLATFILLLSVGIYFQNKQSPLQYIVSMIGVFIGLIIVGISFFIGGWEGLGIGTVGFAIFLGSAISFIIIAIIANMRDLKNQL